MTRPALDYYEVTVAPVGLPVTLAEFKEFARLDLSDTSQDDLLQALLDTATDDLERYTNLWFVEREAIGYYVGLEISPYEQYPFAEIQKSPLLSVSEVAQWVSGAYAATTDYKLKRRDGYARVLFPNSGIATNDDQPYPYRVTFDAGFGLAVDVPQAIKQAIMMYAAYLYENRGDCECGPEARHASGAKMLVARYAIRRVF